MPRTTADPKADIVTFRIAPALKAEFAEIAESEAKPLGELLRELVEERVERERRRRCEAEARRQSALLAAAAAVPDSDEARILRELDANFDELARELDAAEAAAERERSSKPG
jgi:FKBP-type peptidyl-prolyl cis-trans isomerase (trigger factor)